MPRFRHKPSHRRAPKPQASWLIVGYDTSRQILHHGRTTHILPVRSSDHRKRYTTGQRLSVKAFVGGPTECHVNLVQVDRIQLRDVDYPTARELGHIRVDVFREAFAGPDHKWVWVLRFAVDRTVPARLLAQTGRASVSYRKLEDGRWQYVQRPEDAETDRGYTSVSSQSPRDEPAALDDDEWKRHVENNLDLTHAQWVALGRLVELGERARAHSVRGRNMRRKAA